MTTQSAYQRKVATAKAIIDEHNSHLDEADSESHLSWDKILANLKRMGGTTEETLREMAWEDLEDAGVPRILARRIANNVFRKNGDSKDKVKKLTANKVAAMSFTELFENYDPTGERNSAVRDRLQTESGGKRCVVFDPNDETKVLPLDSTKVLRQLRDGLPEQESTHVNGKLVKLYCIGDTPNEFTSENFLFPGQMLRDGVCDNTGRKLSEIPFEAQQIVYLAITITNEVLIDDVEAAHRILDALDCDDPVDKAQIRYTKAALILQDLKRTGGDPKLLIRKGGDHNRPNDPFNTGRHIRT